MPVIGRQDLREAANALLAARRVSAICHENPDADTIGAAVAIARIARALGKEAEVVSVDIVPPVFGFLGEASFEPVPRLAPDLAVICDAATVERVGRIVVEQVGWFEQASLLNIDHHVTNTEFGAVNLVDPTASATCEVVYELMRELAVEPDDQLATALLTGILRDSHGFADPSTSPRTMRIVASLMEAGASLADVHRRILGEMPFSTIALWGRILATARSTADGQVVYATLVPAMLDETGTEQHDADGVVEFLARTQEADVVVLLRAIGPRETRISVRSTERVDATRIAAAFDGGGHARRAGCVVPEPLEAVTRRLLEVIDNVVRTKAAPLPAEGIALP
jgi:phosphoesterase RecJ-like protein